MLMKKLLVFTDIDGTLLDHDSYEWHRANDAISALKIRGYPLILNSSKTVAEIKLLQADIGCTDPFISENGSVIYFNVLDESIDSNIIHLTRAYDDIVTVLSDIRQRYSYKFKGFNDLSPEEVAEVTGLSLQAAIYAKQRHASEPLLWLDDEVRISKFEEALSLYELKLTKGGRFYHVMGKADKAEALKWLLDFYNRTQPAVDWVTMALGDSYNDIDMLRQADISVLIRNPATHQPLIDDIKHLITTELTGPEAWNQAVLTTIEQLQ